MSLPADGASLRPPGNWFRGVQSDGKRWSVPVPEDRACFCSQVAPSAGSAGEAWPLSGGRAAGGGVCTALGRCAACEDEGAAG